MQRDMINLAKTLQLYAQVRKNTKNTHPTCAAVRKLMFKKILVEIPEGSYLYDVGGSSTRFSALRGKKPFDYHCSSPIVSDGEMRVKENTRLKKNTDHCTKQGYGICDHTFQTCNCIDRDRPVYLIFCDVAYYITPFELVEFYKNHNVQGIYMIHHVLPINSSGNCMPYLKKKDGIVEPEVEWATTDDTMTMVIRQTGTYTNPLSVFGQTEIMLVDGVTVKTRSLAFYDYYYLLKVTVDTDPTNFDVELVDNTLYYNKFNDIHRMTPSELYCMFYSMSAVEVQGWIAARHKHIQKHKEKTEDLHFVEYKGKKIWNADPRHLEFDKQFLTHCEKLVTLLGQDDTFEPHCRQIVRPEYENMVKTCLQTSGKNYYFKLPGVVDLSDRFSKTGSFPSSASSDEDEPIPPHNDSTPPGDSSSEDDEDDEETSESSSSSEGFTFSIDLLSPFKTTFNVLKQTHDLSVTLVDALFINEPKKPAPTGKYKEETLLEFVNKKEQFNIVMDHHDHGTRTRRIAIFLQSKKVSLLELDQFYGDLVNYRAYHQHVKMTKEWKVTWSNMDNISRMKCCFRVFIRNPFYYAAHVYVKKTFQPPVDQCLLENSYYSNELAIELKDTAASLSVKNSDLLTRPSSLSILLMESMYQMTTFGLIKLLPLPIPLKLALQAMALYLTPKRVYSNWKITITQIIPTTVSLHTLKFLSTNEAVLASVLSLTQRLDQSILGRAVIWLSAMTEKIVGISPVGLMENGLNSRIAQLQPNPASSLPVSTLPSNHLTSRLIASSTMSTPSYQDSLYRHRLLRPLWYLNSFLNHTLTIYSKTPLLSISILSMSGITALAILPELAELHTSVLTSGFSRMVNSLRRISAGRPSPRLKGSALVLHMTFGSSLALATSLMLSSGPLYIAFRNGFPLTGLSLLVLFTILLVLRLKSSRIGLSLNRYDWVRALKIVLKSYRTNLVKTLTFMLLLLILNIGSSAGLVFLLRYLMY
jgi:hypothetical protein